MTKPKKLMAVFDFLTLPADGFVSHLTAIHDKMFGQCGVSQPAGGFGRLYDGHHNLRGLCGRCSRWQ